VRRAAQAVGGADLTARRGAKVRQAGESARGAEARRAVRPQGAEQVRRAGWARRAVRGLGAGLRMRGSVLRALRLEGAVRPGQAAR
jgi:hypothetical protein